VCENGLMELLVCRSPMYFVKFFEALRDYSVALHVSYRDDGHLFFDASEATISSKHGLPRSGSQNGISFRCP
jgi:hypothetical protein